jgi:RimJ/RimL family protein N-acetyltransferase
MDHHLSVFHCETAIMNRTIETPRLILRPVMPSDAEAIAVKINDFDIAKNLARVPHPYTLADAHSFLDWLAGCKTLSAFRVIALRSSPEQLAGLISYEWAASKQNVELGYWLVKERWGFGYMSEAAQAMVQHAFDVAGVDEMVSCYFDSNPASGKVLRRAGFESVGACTAYALALGRDVPVTNMRLTRARWQALVHT